MDKRLLIPKVSSDISYHEFSDDSYFIHQKTYGHRIKINIEFYDLLGKIDGKKNLGHLVFEVNTDGYDVDLLYTILYEKLGVYGIIESEHIKVKKKGKPSYLKLSFIVIPVGAIAKVTPYLKFLFVPNNMRITMLLSLIIIGFGLTTNFETIFEQDLEAIWVQLFLFGFISVTFHEFGHVTAADYYGAEHGGIGGGFYLFSPVYFADVTDIWKLHPKKRIIVNLAGIYFELIVCSIFIIIGTLFNVGSLSIIGLFIVINTLFNLNPFLRSDGYWILTDLLEIPNLYKKSSESLKKMLSSLSSFKNHKYTNKNVLLSLYASANYILMGVFIYYVVIDDPLSVLYLPISLYEFVVGVYHGQVKITIANLAQFTLPLLFYYLLFKLGQSWLKHIGKKTGQCL